MTATRIAGLATLTAAWIVAALALWQTQVPDDLRLERVGIHAFGPERHDRVLRLLALGSLASQALALGVLAWRSPRVRGRALVRAAQLGGAGALALFVAALPFGLATLWWQRRYEIARLGYGEWLVDRLGPLLVRIGLLSVAAAVCVALAGRLGRGWWLAAAPLFAAIGVGVVLAQPLVSPRLEPLRRPTIVQEVEQLARRQGLPRPEVEVRRTKERTRQFGAEAIGIGPTTRVVLWETTLELGSTRRFLVAHELAHVSRDHLWKGLAWFALLLVPGVALLAWLVPLDTPERVPRALFAAFVLLLVITPLANAISRRYEAEADWVALETTRDAPGAQRMLMLIAEAGVRDPDPPRWWTATFATHPPIADRLGMAEAWVRTRRGVPSREGS